jgi:hypothetical protein
MDFFDKMKDGISKGIDTISTKGKELMDDTQLQLQISSLRDKRRKALEDLGALAYALFQKGALADDGAKAVCATVADLDAQIAGKLAELKHEPASAVVAAAPTALVRCECGAENAPGVKFCSSCGKKTG